MAEKKEWTLMFYFASDNPLAPSIVSQLKAIKDAGFHDSANVIARFDPHADNTPAHIFEVNLLNKLESGGEPQIGFIRDNSFVRNLAADKLWGEEMGEFGGLRLKVRDRIQSVLANRRLRGERGGRTWSEAGIKYDPPKPPAETPNEPTPMQSLSNFLTFCHREYPARRYMLFILGHGLVVGNDLFLFDEHALPTEAEVAAEQQPAAREQGAERGQRQRRPRSRHSLLLTDLGKVLRDFRQEIEKKSEESKSEEEKSEESKSEEDKSQESKSEEEKSEFALVGFHSCSMSALEVAYELQDTASFMLASQGPAFVGSWPYRQILLRIFKNLEAARRVRDPRPIDVEDTLRKIFFYCLYNSYDFQLAGYSFDLALCDLRRINTIKEPLYDLTRALMDGLKYKKTDPLAEDLILLSHWEAQSYWLETCTDLRDFCLRLKARCNKAQPCSEEMKRVLKNIEDEAGRVIEALREGDTKEGRFIVRSECAGPAYQYSHGMSVYFPWSEPAGNPFWDEEYPNYRMNLEPRAAEGGKPAWRDFLKLYFDQTKRRTRADEDALDSKAPPRRLNLDEQILGLVQEVGTQIFNDDGQLSKGGASDSTGSPSKAGGSDPTGGDCDCPSIKNYPATTRALREREAAGVEVSKEGATEGAAEVGRVPFSPTFFEMIMESDPD